MDDSRARRHLSIVIVVTAAALGSGCATSAALRCPAQGGDAWTAIDSPRLRLRSDAAPGRASRLFTVLHSSLAVLSRLLGEAGLGAAATESEAREAGGVAADPGIDVVVIDDRDAFESLAPPGAAGWFVPRPASGEPFDEAPLMVLRGGDTTSVVRRFQHELTHQLLRHRTGERALPPWLEEGLAEYCSTLRWEEGAGATRVTVGELPMRTLLVSEPVTTPGLGARLVDARVPLYEVPRLAELLGAGPSVFHDPAREGAFYSASWVLVHLLAGAAPSLARLGALVREVGAGATVEDGYRHQLAELAPGELESAYRRHLELDDQPGRELLLPGLSAGPLPATPHALPDDEVHLLWARVRPWTSREAIVAAGADIALALGDRPSAEAHYVKARYLRLWRRFEAAEEELRLAVALAAAGASESRYQRALVAVARERATLRGAPEGTRDRGGGGAGHARSAVLAE